MGGCQHGEVWLCATAFPVLGADQEKVLSGYEKINYICLVVSELYPIIYPFLLDYALNLRDHERS